MIINHPLLGPRDSEEFVYLGSMTSLIGPLIGKTKPQLRTSISISTSEKISLVIIKSFGITSRAISLGWL